MKTKINILTGRKYRFALLGLVFLVLSCQKDEILFFPNELLNNQESTTDNEENDSDDRENDSDNGENDSDNEDIITDQELYFDVPDANFEQALIDLKRRAVLGSLLNLFDELKAHVQTAGQILQEKE